jgi:hypothetical protein
MYNTHDVGNGLKLMEHSYIENSYVERIMSMLREPGELTWLCDYYEGDGLTWDNVDEATQGEFLKKSEVNESNYIILNITKKLFIDIAKVYKMEEEHNPTNWPIHPLPILCNSNDGSMGGGDYHPEDSRRATWKGDTIHIVSNTSDIPDGYEDVTEDVLFYE